MTREHKWLLPTACVAIIVAAVSQTGAGIEGAVFAALICAACVLLMLAYRSEKGNSPSPHYGSRFVALFLLGSILVGVLYVLVFTAINPRPGPLNVLWMMGLSLVVGLLLRPRPMGLALSLPLAVTGGLWLIAASVTFRIPLD